MPQYAMRLSLLHRLEGTFSLKFLLHGQTIRRDMPVELCRSPQPHVGVRVFHTRLPNDVLPREN